MNSKNTWIWVIVAAALFATIYGLQKFGHKPEIGPIRVLPGLNAADVTSVQVLPKGRAAMQVDRTNGMWLLLDPPYVAQTPRVEILLVLLQQLTASTVIPAADIKGMTNADQQFGFESPQVSLIINQKQHHILIGDRTALGDQVFVQVVGREGCFVVSAELLKFIPRNVYDWRETALVDWNRLKFDRLVVTNAGKILELYRPQTNQFWRMILPMPTRADSATVEASLLRLKGLYAREFSSDEPNPDLEAFGLQSPELTLAFFQGTNSVLLLHFGRSPTNNAELVYARRDDQDHIMAVARDSFQPWLASASHEFRDYLDHHLISLAQVPDEIEISVHDKENFSLKRQTNGSWQVLPPNYPADPDLMREFIGHLASLEFTEIEKEVVLESGLSAYGLQPAARQYVLKAAATNAVDGSTNVIVAQLDFGVHEGKVYARSKGEDFVYVIAPADLDRLPTESWQLRDRVIWNFSETNVARITILQGGRTREIIPHGTNSWKLAPGSQGDINDLAVGETVHRLGDLAAVNWVAHGEVDRARYGFSTNTNGYQLTIELKNGWKSGVEFGGMAPSGHPYAITRLADEPWLFEFPLPTSFYIQTYLTIPAYIP